MDVRSPFRLRSGRVVPDPTTCGLAQSVRCVYGNDIPNVMYIVRVCRPARIFRPTFAPESKDTTRMTHRAAVRRYPARFGKVDVRLDVRRVYASRFGRRCSSWSSVPASMSARMVELPRRSRDIYYIERVARVPSTRSRGPAGSTRCANAIDARPVTSTSQFERVRRVASTRAPYQ